MCRRPTWTSPDKHDIRTVQVHRDTQTHRVTLTHTHTCELSDTDTNGFCVEDVEERDSFPNGHTQTHTERRTHVDSYGWTRSRDMDYHNDVCTYDSDAPDTPNRRYVRTQECTVTHP